MLVLSRCVGETVVIDDNIEVTVVAVKGDRVRLGIVAPPEVTVDRSEVHARRTQYLDVHLPVPPGNGVIDPATGGDVLPPA
jgi:carbon storage regulator